MIRLYFRATIIMLLASVVVADDTSREKAISVPPPNERLHVQTDRDVRVSTAVPSASETQQIFGEQLYRRNIQPVWVQVENLSENTLWFLPVGLDSGYFTPIETSYRHQNRIPILNLATNRNFYQHSMRLRVGGEQTRSGYVFTRVDEGTKSFNVDVIGPDGSYPMTFFVPVPGLRADHYEVDWDTLYTKDQIEDVDVAGLRAGLGALPCCVRDKKGEDYGDPLNIAVVGTLKDVYYGFLRAGWDETETVYGSSLWRMAKSVFVGSEYRYSPVSALYVYDRPQDVALQKARSTINERNHLRLWITPMRFEGKPVWIGQISRDIGVRFTRRTITTHKIDANVDETREYLLEDLAYAQSLQGFGYVSGVGAASFDEPRSNLTGDPYFTDGLRAVLFVTANATDIADIDIVDLGGQPELTGADGGD